MNIVSATTDLKSGDVVEVTTGSKNDQLDLLAASVGQLFATDGVCWEVVFGQVGGSAENGAFHDFILISDRHVYVVRRSADSRTARVGIVERDASIGLIISEARERFGNR